MNGHQPINWDRELLEAQYRIIRHALDANPALLNAVAQLYWDGPFRIADTRIRDALYNLDLIYPVNPSLLSPEGQGFCRWYSRVQRGENKGL